MSTTALYRWLAMAVFALAMTGCATVPPPQPYVVLLPSLDGTTGAIQVTTAKGTVRVDQKEYATDLDGQQASGKPYPVAAPRIQQDFAAAQAALPTPPVTFLLYFESGGDKLTPESKAKIPEVIDTVRKRGPSAVSVIGHTDTVSGDAWNEKVGLVRAKAIAKLLQSNGLQVLELIVASHGERNLLVNTPDNTPEPRNRRVEITIR